MDLFEKNLKSNPQNNVVGKETYQKAKAKYLPVADHIQPNSFHFWALLNYSCVNHEEQQKLASTGCLWCIKQWTDLPNIGNTKSKELWSQEVNQSINTWSAPKYSQESQNEIWHHTKGTSAKTVEI